MTEPIKPKPLELAFFGYDDPQTKSAFIQFMKDNAEEIAKYGHSWRGPLKLKDGTKITAITPGRIYGGLDGCQFDQVVLADDSRQRIHSARWREISALLSKTDRSFVPERYKILFYDIDAPEPGNETGKGGGRNENIL